MPSPPSRYSKAVSTPHPQTFSPKAIIHNVGVRENGSYFLWRRQGRAHEHRFAGLSLLLLDLVGKRSTVQEIFDQTAQLDISPERVEKTLLELCHLQILVVENTCEYTEGRSWFV